MNKRRCLEDQRYNTDTSDTEESSALLLELPIEILFEILRYCSKQDLAENLRLVCRKLNCIAETILNQAFLDLNKRIPETIGNLNLLLNNKNVSPRYMCVKRDELEIVHYDFKIVRAVVWRHIYFNRPALCSMYAGRYIDSIETILNRPDKVHMPSEITIVQHYSKKFLDHFERTSELRICKDWTKIGSKLLDLLECQAMITRQTRKDLPSVDLENGMFKWKGEFFIDRAWYCVLGQGKTQGWEPEFKKMSRCLRRLLHRSGVYALNEFHCQRQFLRYSDVWTPMKSYYYSGFHRKSVTFYGCINSLATSTRALFLINSDIRTYDRLGGNELYENHEEEMNEDTDDENMILERPNQDLILIYNNRRLQAIPGEMMVVNNINPHDYRMKLKITFELECPLEVAPISIIESLPSMNYKFRPRSEFKKFGFSQDIEISCNVSRNARLPHTYKWSSRLK